MTIFAERRKLTPSIIFLVIAEFGMSIFTGIYDAILTQTQIVDVPKLAFVPEFTKTKLVMFADIFDHFLGF